MPTQFFSNLSQNYIELLNDNEYYDIAIEVGEDSNVKSFHAHMGILCYRSPYLKQTLASNKKSDGSLSFPKILPETFKIILEYIYGGIISLDEQETFNILNVLEAADLFLLQELVDHLQKYLIENKSEWLEENLEFTLRISSKSNNLSELLQFCTNIIDKSPEKLFKSNDFTSLPENILISIIESDDLQTKEIEIWDHVLKWGLAKNPTLIPDQKDWSDDEFKIMETTLQNCLPLIRFFCLSSEEFSKKIRPYKKLLKNQLYEDLLDFYLDPNGITPNDHILLPRNIKINEIIDSRIVNLNIISIISRRIDKMVTNNNFRELYLPYKFKLLLRGSQNGFTPKKFHELCDDKPNTVAFIKVKGTEEILGGYNPKIWLSSSNSWGKTKNSFIFSFKSKNDFRNVIISSVEYSDYALSYNLKHGPYFGEDLSIYSSEESDTNIDVAYCKELYYEKNIRDTDDEFFIEDYEVFQIAKR